MTGKNRLTELDKMHVRSMMTRALSTQAAASYEGVTVAGLAVVAADTGRVFLSQRALDKTDKKPVRETWEFPGGHLDGDEEPFAAASREFTEETGYELPEGEVTDGWRGGKNSTDGHYQGFVYRIEAEFEVDGWTPDMSKGGEVQAVGWFSSEDVTELEAATTLRPELVATMDWTLVFGSVDEGVSGNEAPEEDEDAIEPEASFELLDAMSAPIPIHGVLAPEELESGDHRGFTQGSMTSRPLRLPFRWQESDTGEHNGAVVVGSVDRLMRKDNLIHWEGLLMTTPKASKLVDLIEFFGKFGVSVDGDRPALDSQRSKRTGVAWFDAVRAAGLTAVAIPAFAEAYVALGPHPGMPENGAEGVEGAGETLDAAGEPVLVAGGRRMSFGRGPGWVTNPKETSRLHRYWTQKGQPGYEKVRWGTPGDFRRARALIGQKIGLNNPSKLRFLNQIIAQWHFDALGYWPGELDKPGNKTSEQARAEKEARQASLAPSKPKFEVDLLTASGKSKDPHITARPSLAYFDRHPDTGEVEAGNVTILDPDKHGIRRTFGYAGEWGVCHVGYEGQCVEMPDDPTGAFSDFHLGCTRLDDGTKLRTGLITYKVEHRDAQTMLSESAEQAHYDNVGNAWAAVRLGVDDRGVWFSGVVLPHVSDEDIVLIEASGQVSGEWKYGVMRGLQCVNIPGFPVHPSSAVLDDEGNVLAMAASAFGSEKFKAAFGTSACTPTAAERMQALAAADAEVRMARLKARYRTGFEKGLI